LASIVGGVEGDAVGVEAEGQGPVDGGAIAQVEGDNALIALEDGEGFAGDGDFSALFRRSVAFWTGCFHGGIV
jgi:hypothetical protein